MPPSQGPTNGVLSKPLVLLAGLDLAHALDDGARRACYRCHRKQESEGLLFSMFRQ